MGGQSITKAVSAALNINLDRAEQFKQDLSLDRETSEAALPPAVSAAFASILHEIKYTISLYNDNNPAKIEKVILTGGTSLLGHVTGYLSSELNLNVNIGDPFARVVFPTDIKPVLDRVGARFAVAVGLAMREID
jgi:Tfp pilus assembly PilM family ATPase